MTLFRGSRFRYVARGSVTGVDGETVKVYALTKTTVEAPVQSKVYKVQAGDTFESLAYKEYGDGNKWYVLASVNPDIFWPLDLETGVEILIPPRSFAELL